jgi:hypothetical protein
MVWRSQLYYRDLGECGIPKPGKLLEGDKQLLSRNQESEAVRRDVKDSSSTHRIFETLT